MYKMSGFYRGMEYLANKMNAAQDTKQSIITAVNSYEYIQKKIKEMEQMARTSVQEQKAETIHFDPNEIEPIVLQNRESREER